MGPVGMYETMWCKTYGDHTGYVYLCCLFYYYFDFDCNYLFLFLVRIWIEENEL